MWEDNLARNPARESIKYLSSRLQVVRMPQNFLFSPLLLPSAEAFSFLLYFPFFSKKVHAGGFVPSQVVIFVGPLKSTLRATLARCLSLIEIDFD